MELDKEWRYYIKDYALGQSTSKVNQNLQGHGFENPHPNGKLRF